MTKTPNCEQLESCSGTYLEISTFHLQIKHRYISSTAGVNLGENSKFGQIFGWKWWFWTDENWHYGQHNY